MDSLGDRAYAPRSWWWLAGILSGTLAVGLLARSARADDFSVSLRTDQARAGWCSKRELRAWKRDIAGLTAEERAWMTLATTNTFSHDFTLDGVADTLEITATQYVRSCDLKENVPYKEILMVLTDGATGRRRQWYAVGGLPETYAVDTSTRTITLRGRTMKHEPWTMEARY